MIKTQNLAPYDSKDELINELLSYVQYLLEENARLRNQLWENELVSDFRELDISGKGKQKVVGDEVLVNSEDSDEDTVPQLPLFQQQKASSSLIIREMANKISDDEINTAVPDPRKGRRIVN
jgi:hypothetical protein